MPNNFKLPKLPADWEWVDEANPDPRPSVADAQKDATRGIGSVLRQIAGPPKPLPPPPSFLQDVVAPTAKTAFKMAVPYDDPVGMGGLVASLLLTGPTAPGVRALGKIAPKAAEALGGFGSSGLRRVLGMGAVGGAIGGPGGAMQLLTAQLGGEGARKLTQFARMNAQARDLAASDPVTLGKVVSPIIPGLGSMRSPKDFHVAFKKSAAQTAASQAYAAAFSDVSQDVGQKTIFSNVMRELRGSEARAQSSFLPPGVRGMQAQRAVGGGKGTPASFDDVMETIKRLRTVGYTGDEVSRGLGAKIARDRASELEGELFGQITPAQAGKVQTLNSDYMRAQRIIGFLDDPKLLDKEGNLNIPRLQQKLKSAGYNVRESYQAASDAAELERALFRGATDLGEDIPGKPGKWFGHAGAYRHGGFFALFPKLPTVGKYAGQEPYGLSPTSASLIGQMLQRGINDKPNTLKEE